MCPGHPKNHWDRMKKYVLSLKAIKKQQKHILMN